MLHYRLAAGAAALAVSLAGAATASAQTIAPVPAVPPTTNSTRGFTDAPVPDRSVPEIAPADRAGTRSSQDAGPLNSTPFSGLPGSRLGGGTASPADRDTGGSGVTPNLSR